MPRRNRATPFGEIVADLGRGTLMGNRGVLHDAHGQLLRDSQVRRWIACRLEFRGRHRQLMQPGSYTELFFLDEAAAFAAGHRPCAECRHADYRRFVDTWQQVHPDQPGRADAIDAQLHAERRAGPWRKRTFTAPLATLPDGTYVAVDDRAWLVLGPRLLAWSCGSYREARPRAREALVTVLTPPSLVRVLARGYVPQLHPSAAVI